MTPASSFGQAERQKRSKNQDAKQKVSQMWQHEGSPGLSAHALVSPNVWHPPSFVRSLQLVIYRIWNSGDGLTPGKKKKLVAAARHDDLIQNAR